MANHFSIVAGSQNDEMRMWLINLKKWSRELTIKGKIRWSTIESAFPREAAEIDPELKDVLSIPEVIWLYLSFLLPHPHFGVGEIMTSTFAKKAFTGTSGKVLLNF